MIQIQFVKTFEIPIYHIDVIFIIHNDFNEVDKRYRLKIKEDNLEEDPNESHAITKLHPEYHDKSEIYVMFKPHHLNINAFSHELLHVINTICMTKGINHDAENDEPLVYLQGYIATKITESIVAYMNKNNQDIYKFLLPKK